MYNLGACLPCSAQEADADAAANLPSSLYAALLLWVKKVKIEVPRSSQSFAEQHACTCLRDVANYAGIRSSRTRKMGLAKQAGVLTLEFSFFAHQLVPSYLRVRAYIAD